MGKINTRFEILIYLFIDFIPNKPKCNIIYSQIILNLHDRFKCYKYSCASIHLQWFSYISYSYTIVSSHKVRGSSLHWPNQVVGFISTNPCPNHNGKSKVKTFKTGEMSKMHVIPPGKREHLRRKGNVRQFSFIFCWLF